MINRINIKDLEKFLENYNEKVKCFCDGANLETLSREIMEFVQDTILTDEKVEIYTIYQIMEDFKPIENFEIDFVSTNDIASALEEFCIECGETWQYNLETLTCHDKYGNEVKFVKEEK